MIQPTEYTKMSPDGKLIEWKAVVDLAMELTDGEGYIKLQEIIRELQKARDGIKRVMNTKKLEKKLFREEITPEEYVEAHNVIIKEESERMEKIEPCGAAREFI